MTNIISQIVLRKPLFYTQKALSLTKKNLPLLVKSEDKYLKDTRIGQIRQLLKKGVLHTHNLKLYDCVYLLTLFKNIVFKSI